ncbi:MAG: hypothetical protein Q4F29_00480, partial [Lachnospiraceae bacterium]|nr:hypothetical protein [Lachnospiraceae bacterium]
MTEERYHEFTNKLHQYIHSIDPGDPHRSAMIETFLQTQLRIIDCISKTDHPCILSEEIRLKEWAKFSKTLFVPTNNPSVYEDKLLHAVNRLTWCNLKHKINTSARTYTVG